jgi:Holliday junction DNA helicase RuvA
MIDYLKGHITHVDPDSVVLETSGGVAYRLLCANPYDFNRELSTIVYTYLSVREDAMVLFGFANRMQQSFFKKLLDVNGVGPKMAIGMLAGSTPEAIATAIQQEDVNALSRLPGVGKKTAQRMILDLKDKLDALGIVFEPTAAESPKTVVAGGKAGRSTTWQEAREALRALGFSDVEIEKALASLIGDETVGLDAASELVVKKALQILYRG